MDSEPHRPPIINANIRLFLAVMVLANVGGRAVFTLLPLYMLSLGASVEQVGLSYSLAAIVPIILQILGGWLSDAVGRLRVIAVGSAISVLGYLLFYLAGSWQWILAAMALDYVSSSVVGPSFNAYLAEQSAEAVRGKVFGISKSIFFSVSVIGPFMAGFLADRFGFKILMLAGLLLYLSATLLRIYMALDPRFENRVRVVKKPTAANLKDQLKSMAALLLAGGVVTWIWITDGLGDISANLIDNLSSIYMQEIASLTYQQIGFLTALQGMTMIAATLISGWLTDRFSERLMIMLGFLTLAGGLGVLIRGSTLAVMVAAVVVIGAAFGMIVPAYDSLVSKVIPEDKRGIAYGLFATSLGILSLPAPWLGSWLWDHVDPRLPFLITIMAQLACIPIVWRKFVLPRSSTQNT